MSLPLGYLVGLAYSDHLGANPAEALIRATGEWTLRYLCLTLAITPLRLSMRWSGLASFRRVLGLSTFAYAVLHFFAYAWLDMGLNWGEIADDVVVRPFIFVGFLAFCLLSCLAATSFPKVIKAMGPKRWKLLHSSIYGIAVLAVLHFYWMRAGKNNFGEVVLYALVLGFLLLWRLRKFMIKTAADAHSISVSSYEKDSKK